MENSLPHEKFLHGKILPHNPLPRPHPTRRNPPLKAYAYFPIANNIG